MRYVTIFKVPSCASVIHLIFFEEVRAGTLIKNERESMGSRKTLAIVALVVAIGAPLVLAHPAFAADPNVTQVQDFIRNVIKVVAGLAGLVATVFFVAGGFTYITSSGNPEQLDKAKRTLTWSAVGLAIVIAAFVLANIVTTIASQAFGS